MSNSTLFTGSHSLFSLNPDSEEFKIGIVYSGIALCAVPIYGIVLYVMLTDREITSNPQYRLMNQINLADFGQVIFHILSGLYIVFPQIQVKCNILVRISGCTANSLWLAMFPIMSVLSISRILIIREIVSPKKTPNALKALMVTGWLYTIGVWMWGCITQNFKLDGVGWTYDFSKLGSAELSALEWYLCFPSLGLTYIAYLIIVIHVRMTKRAIRNASGNHEIKIFLQSTFLCAYMVTLIIMWHNAESWFIMSKSTVAVLNSAWIAFSYLNPLLLITLNKTIRQKIFRIMRNDVNHATPLNFSVNNKQTIESKSLHV